MSGVRRGGVSTRGVLAAIALLLVVAACGGIPDHGAVHEVKADEGTSENTVRYSPAGPIKNASPEQIIRGYLDAMLAYPVTTGTAAAFLTPDAARKWKSSAGVEIYVQPRVVSASIKDSGRADDAASIQVGLGLFEDARLDHKGRFSRVNAHKDFSFRLIKRDGQWRIANPQPGFLVNRKFFEDYYRPFDDYYFDRAGKQLVAQPVHLPVGDQLSTALVSSLLAGPGGMLDGRSRSYFPDTTQLRTSIPLRQDGLAEVEFRNDLSTLPDGEQARLSAQLIWTLKQISSITGVRITGGDNVLYADNRGIQTMNGWDSFGPKFGPGDFYALRDDKIVSVSGHTVEPLSGPWGTDAHGATSFAVSGGDIAAVGAGGSTLMIGSLRGKAVTEFPGEDLLPPVWDLQRSVWAVDRPAGATRIRVVTGAKFRTLTLGALRDVPVRSIALSPDGARYALVAGAGARTKILVGTILRNAADQPIGLGSPAEVSTVGPGIDNIRSIAWSDETNVTFLADDKVVGPQVFEARIDGSSIRGGTGSSGALLPDVQARTLATPGGPNAVRYVRDSSGSLWLLRPGSAWVSLAGRNITFVVAASSTG